MKTIAIGDIHGRSIWKKILDKEKDFDKVIFIGDYFDSHNNGYSGPKQKSNFLEICKLKIEQPDKVILLVGNHDYHYFDLTSNERYTGYNDKYAFEFNIVLRENLNLLQLCYIQNDIIFSHAGISKGFLVSKGLITKEEKFEEFSYSNLVADLNDLLKYKPNEFSFIGNMLFNEKGDDITQSPIWIRPYSLILSGIPIRQVVGHTTQDEILNYKDKFYFIDSLQNNNYLKIENENISIETL